jgi:hypothetical protein
MLPTICIRKKPSIEMSNLHDLPKKKPLAVNRITAATQLHCRIRGKQETVRAGF